VIPGAEEGAPPVLHADAALLVVDKPAGRLVIPGRGGDELSLREELEAAHGRLWVVHRLDRGTTGVLVFARTAEAHRALNLAFDRGEPRKRYVAIVRGEPPAEACLDAPIAPARRGRMRPGRPGDPRAKAAVTRIRSLETFPPRAWAGGALALVEAAPETGRTHQIRVHLMHAGYPLAVDPDYGDEGPLHGPGARVLLSRTPLHAARLELRHPSTGATLVLEAPLPADMAEALQALRAG
jgi:tRNA pseudouridine32 synthase/23S rRNA pseudouridine746 synthase